MKKLCLMVLTFAACAGYARPVGNPCEASLLSEGMVWEGCPPSGNPLSLCDNWSIRVGVAYDHLFDKVWKMNTAGSPRLDNFEMSTYSAYFALNFWDRLDIFGTAGVSNFEFDGNLINFDTSGTFVGPVASTNFNVQSTTAGAWSIGARGTLCHYCGFCLGAMGEYFETRPDIKKVTGFAYQTDYPDDTMSVINHEWQFGGGISYCEWQNLIPYVAMRWSRSTLRTSGQSTIAIGGIGFIPYQIPKLEADTNWGVAAGATLVRCCSSMLTIEGRAGKETGVYLNGQIRF